MTIRELRFPILLMAFTAAVAVAGCAGPMERAERYAAQEEWMKAVVEYRKAASARPDDIEARSRLRQVELKAADYYYLRGARAAESGEFEAAVEAFQQGLAAMPDHSKLLAAMKDVLARREAARFFDEAQTLLAAGKTKDAQARLKKVLEIHPEHRDAAKALAAIETEDEAREAAEFTLTAKHPVTLNFQQTELRTAFEFLAKSFGVNVIFDDAFKSVPVTLFAKDVTFEQGLGLLLSTTRNFYKRIGPNTVLIAPDTKEKRGQYEEHRVRTFQLNTVRAKDMAEIVKGLLTVKKIIVNEQLNTVALRDTPEVLRQAERIIEVNDKKPAEIILEVEILEVNRTKAERLGLDLGSYQVSAALPNPVSVAGSIRESIRSTATLTLPSATFRFFKQDVDAKILANPKVRVVNGKGAKIHIGDRVPLRVATILDATGQTRTTFDYKDIGVRLLAEPTINLDNSCTVKLNLEVSSLGENLGTVTEPAFSIGTRNAETFMLLRDGETAILGGLIRDEERRSKTKLPGVGDIPAIGAVFFTSHDDSDKRTDILLTITPRVVRGWDVPTRTARDFHSGTENSYDTQPLFASLQTAARSDAGRPLAPQINARGETATGAAPAATASAPPAGSDAEPPKPAPALFAFSESAFEIDSGKEAEIRLIGQNLTGIESLPVEILYNPQLLSFVRAAAGDPTPKAFSADADQAKGVVRVGLTYEAAAASLEEAVLAKLVFKGEKSGVSYLVYRQPALKNAAGESIRVQARASRIVVR